MLSLQPMPTLFGNPINEVSRNNTHLQTIQKQNGHAIDHPPASKPLRQAVQRGSFILIGDPRSLPSRTRVGGGGGGGAFSAQHGTRKEGGHGCNPDLNRWVLSYIFLPSYAGEDMRMKIKKHARRKIQGERSLARARLLPPEPLASSDSTAHTKPLDLPSVL